MLSHLLVSNIQYRISLVYLKTITSTGKVRVQQASSISKLHSVITYLYNST